jgi:hypothetical protein
MVESEEVELVRRVCLSLPEVTEQEAWGEPTFRVRKKVFAMYADAGNHHGAGTSSLWCNAPLGVQKHLIEADSERYFSPPYVGVKGWIGIRLPGIRAEELLPHVLDSYCMVAPRKLLPLVDALARAGKAR